MGEGGREDEEGNKRGIRKTPSGLEHPATSPASAGEVGRSQAGRLCHGGLYYPPLPIAHCPLPIAHCPFEDPTRRSGGSGHPATCRTCHCPSIAQDPQVAKPTSGAPGSFLFGRTGFQPVFFCVDPSRNGLEARSTKNTQGIRHDLAAQGNWWGA